jgi:hypothetical protein
VEAFISQLNMQEVRDHYVARERVHQRLRTLFVDGNVHEFVSLALGISDPVGNYSAAEHLLGPRILAESRPDDVFHLASEIEACPTPHHLPGLIYRHSLPCLKISVGSEIAMMLKPAVHWVGNVRTIWSHLLVKHQGNQRRANEELALYRDGESDSEMDYPIWREIYLALEPNLRTVGHLAAEAAVPQGVEAGAFPLMWADAVANFLYDRFADPRQVAPRTRVRSSPR